METHRLKRIIVRVGFVAACIVSIVFFIFPFCWVLLMSLKTPDAAQSIPPTFIFRPTFENFREVLSQGAFLNALKNSIIVTFFTLVANLIISLPASYIIARRRQKWLSFGILFTQMAPWIVFLLPWYIIFKKLGLYDTYIGLVLVNLTFMIPFTIWLMLGFFEDVPVEVEEAAWLDGCSYTGTFVRIVIPLVKGGIITITTLGFMGVWNVFIFPLVLSGYQAQTLPVLVYGFLVDDSLNFGPMSAAAVLITLPVVAFVLLNQKYFQRGIALGGRK
ncbi:MAG: carbohydrate ABC transporter permease [Deltaproteobacteria bacterium]|nr:carbohydrate ABC transporter permease [Deltaproteobacteria bacterium]MBW2051137.1 carbohydrate ABC transporter permease [Deltaproteobacteria bacterium]MBW2139930.1 carbohydrate ABC transporter permease [Deltaproteobacteria bacterium]MBW2324006.1 carbohydrate ABC transporter permease [Deltaproteobacteria bacterium]